MLVSKIPLNYHWLTGHSSHTKSSAFAKCWSLLKLVNLLNDCFLNEKGHLETEAILI